MSLEGPASPHAGIRADRAAPPPRELLVITADGRREHGKVLSEDTCSFCSFCWPESVTRHSYCQLREEVQSYPLGGRGGISVGRGRI